MGAVKKEILVYGVVGGLLIALLRVIEYRWLLVEHTGEVYVALVAALFAGVGIWLGLRLTKTKETVVVREVPVPVPAHSFERDDARAEALGLTARELEILELIAQGLSTREMAGRLFVSENTVKTHAGRVLAKLGARRRTEAVRLARAQRLIP